MDFSGFLSVIDFAPVVLAIMALGALKILPSVILWGAGMVIDWFR